MKKPLLLFIIFTVLLLVAGTVYHRYCKAHPGRCRQVKMDEDEKGPRKGIDW